MFSLDSNFSNPGSVPHSPALFNKMGTETNKDDRNTPEYLAQLLKDKKQIQAFPNVFITLEKLLDEEINRVRLCLFHNKSTAREPLTLPDPSGPVVTLSEKLYVPAKEHPDFNFVGRILGPRGMTAKELEQYTGCKIMVRGKGSMRDKLKEEQNKGKPNWEHLNEDLHVLITIEDTRARAELKLIKAKEEVKKLLVPSPEGEDELKKMQLMELAILNGTYRDSKFMIPVTFANGEDDLKKRQLMELAIINGTYRDTTKPTSSQSSQPSVTHAARFMTSPMGMTAMPQMRSPTPQGAPLILAPRVPTLGLPSMCPSTMATTMMNGGGPPPLVSPTESSNYFYNPYNPYEGLSLGPGTVLDLPFDQSAAGWEMARRSSIPGYNQNMLSAVPKLRRTVEGLRVHPYGLPTNF